MMEARLLICQPYVGLKNLYHLCKSFGTTESQSNRNTLNKLSDICLKIFLKIPTCFVILGVTSKRKKTAFHFFEKWVSD